MAQSTRPPFDPKVIAVYEQGLRLGTQEFAGFLLAELDRQLAGEASAGARALTVLRNAVAAEIERRFPGYDLEAEAKRHAVREGDAQARDGDG